jgi:hypothetical protein
MGVTYYVQLSRRRQVQRAVYVAPGEDGVPRVFSHGEHRLPDGKTFYAADEDLGWPPHVLTEERRWHALPDGVKPHPVGHVVADNLTMAAPPAPTAKRVFAFSDHRAPGVVLELIEERESIEDELHPGFMQHLTDVTDHDLRPEVGWVLGKDGKFSPPAPYVPTRGEEMATALAAGLRVTGKFAATYDATGPRWQRMLEEAQYAREFSAFSAGREKLEWQSVTFETPDELRSVMRAIADWIARWHLYVEEAGDAPSDTVEV